MATPLRGMVAVTGLVLAAGVVAEAIGSRAFTRRVRDDVRALESAASDGKTRLVGEEDLDGLPEPVQRYLRFTGVVGKPFVRRVHLRQEGRMLLGQGLPWIRLEAEQWHSVDPPGFVWDATLYAGPVPLVRARDMVQGGKGNMLVRALSSFTVADAKGEEIDQGEMMRYLSEMIWFPSAFLGDNISFEAVDAGSARVTLTDHGRTVTGTLFFDADGRVTEFVGRRRHVSGELETWSAPSLAYGELEGLRLPTRGKAVWKLERGDEEYIDVTLTELEHAG